MSKAQKLEKAYMATGERTRPELDSRSAPRSDNEFSDDFDGAFWNELFRIMKG